MRKGPRRLALLIAFFGVIFAGSTQVESSGSSGSVEPGTHPLARKRVPVDVAFRATRGGVGFKVGKYDPTYPLTIDPAYSWHTFYGSSSDEWGNAIAVDGTGNIYITGNSYAAWDGPDGRAPLHAYSGYNDIFVMKLDNSGTYKRHTFYESAAGIGEGASISIDESGNVYVTGFYWDTWTGPSGQEPLHASTESLTSLF